MRNTILGGFLAIGALLLLRAQRSFFSPDEFDAYVINLNKRRERLLNFNQSYIKSDIGKLKAVKRFEAVDGARINVNELVTPKMAAGIKKLEMTGVKTDPAQLSRGMLGCYKSHFDLFEEIYEGDKQYGLIFEDDAVMDPKIYEKINNRIVFPEEWDIILLGHVRLMQYEKGPTAGLLRVHEFWGTHTYLISRRGVGKMLLYKNMPIELQIDGFMSKLAQEGKLDVFATDPPLTAQARMGTDIQVRTA